MFGTGKKLNVATKTVDKNINFITTVSWPNYTIPTKGESECLKK